MGNEESMMAEGNKPGEGQPGAGMGTGSMGNTSSGPSLGNIGLGNLSNLSSSITNTIKNQANQASAGGGLSNLANLGSNLTSNLTNQAKNLASNLDNIGANLTNNLSGNIPGPTSSFNKPTSNLNPGGPSMINKTSPAPKQDIPDVDLTGLTEEEKAMIQSVMMRAQEGDTNGPSKDIFQQNTTIPNQQQQNYYNSGSSNLSGQLNSMGTMIQKQREEELMKTQQSGTQNYDTTNFSNQQRLMEINQSLIKEPGSIQNQAMMQQQTDQNFQQQQNYQTQSKPKDMFCPICRISILMPSNEQDCKCFDCADITCKNCGLNSQSNFNEKTWLCVNCNKKREQIKKQEIENSNFQASMNMNQNLNKDMISQQQLQSNQDILNQQFIDQNSVYNQLNTTNQNINTTQNQNLNSIQNQIQNQNLNTIQNQNNLQQPINKVDLSNNMMDLQNQQLNQQLNQQTNLQQIKDPTTGQIINTFMVDNVNQSNLMNNMDNQEYDPVTGLMIPQNSMQQQNFNQTNNLNSYNNFDQNIQQSLNRPQDGMTNSQNQQMNQNDLSMNQNKMVNEINNNLLTENEKINKQNQLSMNQSVLNQNPMLNNYNMSSVSTMQNTLREIDPNKNLLNQDIYAKNVQNITNTPQLINNQIQKNIEPQYDIIQNKVQNNYQNSYISDMTGDMNTNFLVDNQSQMLQNKQSFLPNQTNRNQILSNNSTNQLTNSNLTNQLSTTIINNQLPSGNLMNQFNPTIISNSQQLNNSNVVLNDQNCQLNSQNPSQQFNSIQQTGNISLPNNQFTNNQMQVNAQSQHSILNTQAIMMPQQQPVFNSAFPIKDMNTSKDIYSTNDNFLYLNSQNYDPVNNVNLYGSSQNQNFSQNSMNPSINAPKPSKYSPNFQRKMPQIKPYGLERSRSREKELPCIPKTNRAQSPYGSPTSVSSCSSLADSVYHKNNKMYPNHHQSLEDRLDQNSAYSHHRSPKHIKYSDEVYQHENHYDHNSINKGSNDYSKRDYYNTRDCTKYTKKSNLPATHHQRSLSSPRKIPLTRSICKSDSCDLVNRDAACETCNNYSCVDCNHHYSHHHHTSPKHHNTAKTSYSCKTNFEHPKHENHFKQCSAACASSKNFTTDAVNDCSQHQQTFNSFHQQQQKLLEKQEQLVNGIKKLQKKKIKNLQDVWSPSSSSSQISTVDIGPLIGSIVAPIEKEIEKNEKLKRANYNKHECKQNFEIEEIELSIPKIKHENLNDVLETFNKKIEKLSIKNTNTDNSKLVSLNENDKDEQSRKFSLDSKAVSDFSPPFKIENKKLPKITAVEKATEINKNENQSVVLRFKNLQNIYQPKNKNQSMETANYATMPTSATNLAVQPIKKTLEKIVSPVIDKTMQQQQLLINQQQQLILLQKEQNRLQQQLQEQLKKQQDTQIARELKLEKEQRLLELQRQQQAQLLELEHQELKLKQEKQYQAQQQALQREAVKKQLQSQHQALQREQLQSQAYQVQTQQHLQQQQIQQQQLQQQKELQRQQQQIQQQQQTIQQQQQQQILLTQQAEQKKEELMALSNMVPINTIPAATVLAPTSVLPTQIISAAPILQANVATAAPLISNSVIPQPINSLNQTYDQPMIQHPIPIRPSYRSKELPEIPRTAYFGQSQFIDDSMISKNSYYTGNNLSMSTGNTLTRKDRRRLPQPTYEEIQQATVAIGLNNRLSGLSTEQQQQQLMSGCESISSVSSTNAFKRNLQTQLSLPELPISNQILDNMSHKPVSLAGSKITSSTVFTTVPLKSTAATTSLSTGSLPQAIVAEMNKNSKTNFSKYKTFKDRALSPHGDISDSLSETSFRAKGKTLPNVPKNEVPVTMNSLRKLNVKNTFNKSILQRPSSSLDFTENDQLLKQTMLNSILNSGNKSLSRSGLNKSFGNILSPYSSLSDIANLINQSSAVTLGRLSPAIIASTHADKLGGIDVLKSRQNPLYKTVKYQLKQELKSALGERKRLLELRSRSDLSKADKLALLLSNTNAANLLKRRSETDLRNLSANYDPNTTNVKNLLNNEALKNKLLERTEDRLSREQRAARIKAEIEKRKLNRNKHSLKKHHLPSTNREILNSSKNLADSNLLNDKNFEDELAKEVELADIEQLEQKILENELMNEELANQDLMEQHLRNMKILNQYNHFTGSYMPNLRRQKASDDYFGAKKQKILARQQQIARGNNLLRDYSYDDLYVHRNNYPNYFQNVQTGGLNLHKSHQNLPHITKCLKPVTHNYPHRGHLAYGENNLPLFGEFPSRCRKLVENLTCPNIDAAGLDLNSMPLTVPVIQTASSSNLYEATNLNQRLMPLTKPKYSFPIKRVFLTRESKERTAMNNGNPFGIQIIGGQQIPGTNMLGAFVTKILPGTFIGTLGELREGNQVLEWNGIPLTGLRNNEVQQIMINSYGLEEVEITIKDDRQMNSYINDYNMNSNAMIDPNMHFNNSLHQFQQQQFQQQQFQQQQLSQHLIPTAQFITAPQVSAAPIITTSQVLTVPQLMTNTALNVNSAALQNQNLHRQSYLTNPVIFAGQQGISTNTSNIRPFENPLMQSKAIISNPHNVALQQQPQVILQNAQPLISSNLVYPAAINQLNQPNLQGQNIPNSAQNNLIASNIIRY